MSSDQTTSPARKTILTGVTVNFHSRRWELNSTSLAAVRKGLDAQEKEKARARKRPPTVLATEIFRAEMSRWSLKNGIGSVSCPRSSSHTTADGIEGQDIPDDQTIAFSSGAIPKAADGASTSISGEPSRGPTMIRSSRFTSKTEDGAP
jgi:hypothetical protein